MSWPAAQGTGVATALVEAAVDAAAGREAVKVVAREELPETVVFPGQRHDFAATPTGPAPTSSWRRGWASTSLFPNAETTRRLGDRVGRSLVAGDPAAAHR